MLVKKINFQPPFFRNNTEQLQSICPKISFETGKGYLMKK